MHDKTLSQMDVSRNFLCGYLDSLLAIARKSDCDSSKGKDFISYEPTPKTHMEQQWHPSCQIELAAGEVDEA